MDIRLEEGLLGEDVIIERLKKWWSENSETASQLKRSRRLSQF
jgi:hypothetical protein